MSKRHFGFRMDSEIFDKLHYIAKYEGRSATGLMIYLINIYIRKFEAENGPIITKDKE